MRYTIEKIGEFYEIFDWVEKITIYVTMSKNRALKNLRKAELGQQLHWTDIEGKKGYY